MLFDGQSSRAHPARLTLHGNELVLHAAGAELRAPIERVRIEAPLGGLRRVLLFPTGVRFETDDRDVVTVLERRLRRNRGLGFVHRLEQRWPLVLASLVILAVAGWAFTQFGLPVLARAAASVTPRPMLAALDRQSLAFLDRQLLEPTELPAATRQRLRREFAAITNEIGGPYRYTLEFRTSEALGANAFALPNGTIIATDDLVRLAGSDREVLGVLAHEVGHVTHRHGTRSIYQSVGLLMFVAVLTGDVASASTVAGTVSLALVQSGYSRDMEREADDVAGRYLMQRYGTTRPLRSILRRLSDEHGDTEGLVGLLSTHPGVSERLQHLQSLEGTR